MPEYDLEAVDKLPFSTPERAQRCKRKTIAGPWAQLSPPPDPAVHHGLLPDPMNWRSLNSHLTHW